MKLLLVDDEAGIREGLAALLRRRGHEVLTAGDCAKARELLDGDDVDLVITDWRLPDGRAAEFIARSTGPVVAMSGHPEEVAGYQAIHEVLTKPVQIGRLLAVIARYEPAASAMSAPLPADVSRLIADARAVLKTDGHLEDDGTFVLLRAPLADESQLAGLRRLGGDLRVLAPRGQPVVELRWCRDGRPAADMPVVRPDDRWPLVPQFAVDLHGTGLSVRGFEACLDRAREHRAQGRSVHLLNVPDSLLSWASDQGRADDMPMRAAVGPRLPAVLADLWS
ncbi:MAG: response regulator [Planctomycetes bacterium]|nr:response regulator [Planctomycetota bacterium]